MVQGPLFEASQWVDAALKANGSGAAHVRGHHILNATKPIHLSGALTCLYQL